MDVSLTVRTDLVPGLPGLERPRWGRVMAQSPVATLIVDLDVDGGPGVVRAANAAAACLLGGAGAQDCDDVIGVRVAALLPPSAMLVLRSATGATVVSVPATAPPGVRWLAASMTPLADPGVDGSPRALLHVHDVTDHWAIRTRLDREAREDPLTGLFNRAELLRQLAALDPRVDGPNVAVVFLDLDGFKLVNDTRGHLIGDELLVAVARRIDAVLRPEDRLARLGGDEFVILCLQVADVHAAQAIAERVRATLDQPLALGGRSHRITMSVGVALSDVTEIEPVDLLRAADMAMYRAKDAGRNTVRLHSVDMDAELLAAEQTRESLLVALGEAADSDVSMPGDPARMVMHFQPIVEIATGRLAYVEALSRLQSSTGVLLRPAQFLAIAARAGLNAALSERVLGQALDQRARWCALGVDVPVGINLTRGQVGSATFADDALRIIAERGDSPDSVVLEMDEFGLLEATGPAQLTLRRLRACGIGLAIDHFGTGYSSLGALRFLGPHRVKIDRAFVASITDSAADRAIVTAAISAAHALGQRVVASGVETSEQLDVLAGLGCDEAQGYLISRVRPGPELALETLAWGPGTLVRVPAHGSPPNA